MDKILLGIALMLSITASAQVTIGTDKSPAKGALLDLKDGTVDPLNAAVTAKKGLGMPRVKLEAIDKLTVSIVAADEQTAENKAHTGVLVYNTEEKKVGNELLCKGLQVWTGTKWQPLSPYTQGRIDSETPMSVTTRTVNTGWTGSAGAAPRPLGQFKDIRGTEAGEEINFYEHALMYYEDVEKETWTAYTGVKASCDPNTSGDVVGWDSEKVTTTRTNVPVIMMTENLNTRYTPTGELLAVHTAANEVANAVTFYPGNNQNGTTTDKLLNVALPKTWTDGHGMTYNWAAATVGADGVHGKGGADGLFYETDESKNKEGAQVQGICPAGWHLPSDLEYIELEKAMALKASHYSNGITNDGATSGNIITAVMGNVWRSPLIVPSAVTPAEKGQSISSFHGGFNLLLVGYVHGGQVQYYGRNGYIWDSSFFAHLDCLGWPRGVRDEYGMITTTNLDRDSAAYVRCKKNN